ncbi:hypothetical protein IQ07DRAFT_215311 [Pyrenochaeta sp. DS3sAY3a]|nr:hypothetical protein IQ07DRAFT_215311 [Pyrenochaeta sp. DS3sAY3a]
MNTAQRRVQLLDLPPELRNHIYDYIVDGFERKSIELRVTKHVRGVIAQLPRAIISLLLTCKTIWLELLSLLFGSYVWSTDLRVPKNDPDRILILPGSGWLNKPSTLAAPTSGNIRHVRLKLDHIRPHLRANTATGETRRAIFEVTIEILKQSPYFVSTVKFASYSSMTPSMPWWHLIEGQSRALQQELEQGVERLMQNLATAKAERRESITNLTVEEWREIVLGLNTVYLSWIRRLDRSRSRQRRH